MRTRLLLLAVLAGAVGPALADPPNMHAIQEKQILEIEDAVVCKNPDGTPIGMPPMLAPRDGGEGVRGPLPPSVRLRLLLERLGWLPGTGGRPHR